MRTAILQGNGSQACFCVFRTKQAINLVYIATRQIYRIFLSALFRGRKLCCLFLFLENCEILENFRQNRS